MKKITKENIKESLESAKAVTKTAGITFALSGICSSAIIVISKDIIGIAAIGGVAVGSIAGTITGIVAVVAAISDNINSFSKSRKLGAITAGVLIATAGIFGLNKSSEFIDKKAQEYKQQQALIEEANTKNFNADIEISGSFNKLTNTYTIKEIEGVTIPKSAKIKLELNQ